MERKSDTYYVTLRTSSLIDSCATWKTADWFSNILHSFEDEMHCTVQREKWFRPHYHSADIGLCCQKVNPSLFFCINSKSVNESEKITIVLDIQEVSNIGFIIVHGLNESHIALNTVSNDCLLWCKGSMKTISHLTDIENQCRKFIYCFKIIRQIVIADIWQNL